MVALNDINTVTSQFVYQAWGIEMPTLQQLAAPFQPIVEMLCSAGTLCQSQALIELAVTESSSLGFWLSEVSITTLFHGGIIENHYKLFSGLLSRIELWGSSSGLESKTVDVETECTDKAEQTSPELGPRASTQQGTIDCHASSAQKLSLCPKAKDPASGCEDSDMELVDWDDTPDLSTKKPPDISKNSTAFSFAIEGLNEDIGALKLTNYPQPSLPTGRRGPDNAETEPSLASTTTEEDIGEEDYGDDADDNIDADYWQWDPERQQYRHWNEKEYAWAYFPGTLH